MNLFRVGASRRTIERTQDRRLESQLLSVHTSGDCMARDAPAGRINSKSDAN